LVACVVALATAGCATTSRVATLGELAGTWEGRFALRLANAAAAMEVTPEGAYKGTVHTEAGERPFSGAIVRLPSGRLRYQGTHGNGIVMLSTDATRP